LGLEGTPSDEVFEGTCRVWLDALKGRDASALQTAFDVVERTATRWPVPAQVIAAMPAYRPTKPEHRALVDEASRERVRGMIEECAKRLRVS